MDLESDREVSTAEGQELAKKLGCPFRETSAKNNINVDEGTASHHTVTAQHASRRVLIISVCVCVPYVAFSDAVREIRSYYKEEKAAAKKSKGGCTLV